MAQKGILIKWNRVRQLQCLSHDHYSLRSCFFDKLQMSSTCTDAAVITLASISLSIETFDSN